ncbi:hypothetical protein K7G98_40795, partial [Saccharothrix sp. MB29]|nr:hypothetical protein [Saccharothrix sp. MB29]
PASATPWSGPGAPVPPPGATPTAPNPNPGPPTTLPPGPPDSQGTNKLFTYDGAGNPLSSANTAASATSKVDYNADGTLNTSTDPRD